MSAQEVPQLENAVEVKEGKLSLSAAARQAFEDQAIFVDDCLARMDQLIRDNTTRIDFAAKWGKDKLTSMGARSVRERVAKELSALFKDLPVRLALNDDKRDKALGRSMLRGTARSSRIDDMKTEVEDQLDQIIQKAITPGGGSDTTTEAMLAAVQRRSNF